jgi:hypothetical protein
MNPAAPDPNPDRTWRGGRLVWIAGGLATAIAVALETVYLFHAGGLWRDEAQSVALATLPTWHDVWELLPHDNSPILFTALLRLWCGVGAGGSDQGLRVLGFLFGILLPLSFWVGSWSTRRGVPLLPLALVAVNANLVRSGDSLRAYGLGSALNVLSLALTWRVAQRATVINVALAATAAVASVQCLYQNAFFVLAACSAGLLVCFRERRWRNALCVLGIGLAAAASLIPYARGIVRSQEWWIVEKAGFDLSLAWENLSAATGFPFASFAWIWVALFGLAVITLLRFVRRRTAGAEDSTRAELILFGGTALLVGLAGYRFFLELANLPTQSWYYLPLLAFVAASLDLILPVSHRRSQPALAVFAALTAVVALPLGWSPLKIRQTNVDLIAARLTSEAGRDDFIIVHPWYCGVSFARYYHGPTPWTTLPPLDDYTLHRYDQFKQQMQTVDPLRPVQNNVAATLKNGHRLWLVGRFPWGTPPPPPVQPAPDNPWGWYDLPYSLAWGAQTADFVAAHAERRQDALPGITNGVSRFEALPVTVATGWRADSPPTNSP